MGLWSKLFIKQTDVNELQAEYEKTVKALRATKEELEDLKLKKRLEQEEITHMVKINEERKDSEVEKKKIELERKYNEDINKFREEQTAALLQLTKELHGKLEGRFNVELGNLKEIYQALMARLPNVNLTLEKRLR